MKGSNGDEKGEYLATTRKLRTRVEEIFELFGVGQEFKKSDLATDLDLLELYPKPTVLNNLLTRELDRRMETGEVSHTGKQGFYRIEKVNRKDGE